jgi:hypothetical protein
LLNVGGDILLEFPNAVCKTSSTWIVEKVFITQIAKLQRHELLNFGGNILQDFQSQFAKLQ